MASVAPEIIDYAIVGQGCAGLYVAWRLARHHHETHQTQTIRLFEATARPGGRLLTETLPELNIRAELGGMRYTDQQLLFSGLVKEFKLNNRRFKYDCDRMFVRGQHIAADAAAGQIPYQLKSGVSGGADSLVSYALHRALIELELSPSMPGKSEIAEQIKALTDASKLTAKSFTARQWRALKSHSTLHGTPLYSIGFWNLLHYYLGNEGFLFVHDTLGYESIVANWNAAEAIPWFLRDFNSEYLTISDGMDNLPIHLSHELMKLLGRDVTWEGLRHHLKKLEPCGVDRGRPIIRLEFENQKPALAHHVILALPQKALRALEIVGQEWQEEYLDSVCPQRLFKLILGYKKAWWSNGGHRRVTDLPIRQVYFFNQGDNEGPVHVMASYSDAHYVDFWSSLNKRFRGHKYYFKGKEKERSDSTPHVFRAFGASLAMVAKAHRQLVELHPELSETLPMPEVALAQEWQEGWHTWETHRQPWLVMQALKQPLIDQPVYICGEAFSCEQGWVEGALRSAELVLKALGVPPPTWVANQEYQLQKCSGYDEYIEDF